MQKAGVWDVDRILAAQILTELGLERTDERVEIVARNAAQHRMSTATWAAERAHQTTLQAMAERMQSEHAMRRSEWYDGFREAEASVVVLSVSELLDAEVAPVRSRGAILRSMIRQARGGSLARPVG